MGAYVNLTKSERDALDHLRERLLEEGLRITDERFILSLLKAAARLPEEDLVELIKQGLIEAGPDPDEATSSRKPGCRSAPRQKA